MTLLNCPIAAKKQPIDIVHSEGSRLIRYDDREELHFWGNTEFLVDSATTIKADSVVLLTPSDILKCFGNVEIFDTVEHIWADRIVYYRTNSLALAEGNVVMIHSRDSVKTVSRQAEYNRRDNTVFLTGEPALFLNYPDFNNMVSINSEYMLFLVDEKRGEAINNVTIEHKDTRAECRCAEFYAEENSLILDGAPHAVRGESDITGRGMEIRFSNHGIQRIHVFDEAKAIFVEEADSLSSEFSGKSNLSADEIRFDFLDGEVRRIAAMGEARSEYYPPENDTTEAGKNFVSGDSIFIHIKNQKTKKIDIIGGAEGIYITKREGDKSSDSTVTDSTAAIDTTAVSQIPIIDSTMTQGLLTDSLDTMAVTAEDIVPEDTIHYRGRYLEFFVDPRIIRITGNSVVRQEDAVLTANQIDYDIPKRIVVAKARVDTVSADSTVVYPLVLRDAGDEISGSRLVFNIDTKKGKIEDATTKFEQSYYQGDDLYKEDEKVFYVKNGVLTPCELEDANVHFTSKKMKVINNDKAIARPVIMYIEDIPVMAIPYYVFPLKRGRHSGILPIRLGNFERGNRYLGNIGYYWAASEYWDLQSSFDYYENTGWVINGLFRYNKRYAYSGTFSGSYAKDTRESVSGVSRSLRWSMTGNHAQTLPYDIDFRASGTFVSDKNYYTDYSTDQSDRLNRSLRSQANFNKRWGFGSLSLSFNHTNNLDTESKSSSLPSGSFSVITFHPFGEGHNVDGKLQKKWYNYPRLKYGNNFGLFVSSSKGSDGIKDSKEYAYIDHSMSLSTTMTVLKYFSLTGSVDAYDTWYYILPTNLADEDGIDAHKPYRRGAASASLGTNTNLYGTFPVGLLGLQSLRHVITPSIGFSWAPAITKNDAVKNYVGRGHGGNQSKTMSLSLTQLLQAKIAATEGSKKLDILRISSSTSYNFEAIGPRKFSDLSTSLSSSLIKNVNLSGTITHDMYDQNDKLIWYRPRLSSFSIATSFQAKGSVGDDYTSQSLETSSVIDSLHQEEMAASGLNHEITQPTSATDKTNWNLSLSHRYSESGYLTGVLYRTHWLKVTFDINLTANWRIKYQQNYDFIAHESTEKVVDIVRTLPCWEGHFYWIPNGSRQGYYFKLNLLTIPDIKFEKSESGLRGALFNR